MFLVGGDHEGCLIGGVVDGVDHVVYGAPELEGAVAKLETLLGVRATEGGRHPDEGTRNALIALGPATYLEIVAPDPEAPRRESVLWLGLGGLLSPRLTTWAAKSKDLETLARSARSAGVLLGFLRRGSRLRPDGVALSWTFTDPHAVVEDGLVPFFIDWGDSPHPAGTAATGCRLLDFRAEHPEPDRVRRALSALGIALPVSFGSEPALVALLETPKGKIELR